MPFYQDSKRMARPSHATVESVVQDYLQALMSHTWSEIKRRSGSIAFKKMTFECIITVPAVWSDKAKEMTRTCAEKAGMGPAAKIQLISEPEAAAIHSITTAKHNFQLGDTIVICDAGGRTVDLITFTILQLQPFICLEETAPGNGSLCGSTFLHRSFENLLRRRFSHCDGWGEDTMNQAMLSFDAVVQRFSGNKTSDYMLPVPGIPNNERLGVC
ncbi:hypothetical protein N7512_000900 [Penicillium capsulatum]|nr:hypothetical protein N7512_000900 [Penicillium capsulatum]